jgi:hypothetical protein
VVLLACECPQPILADLARFQPLQERVRADPRLKRRQLAPELVDERLRVRTHTAILARHGRLRRPVPGAGGGRVRLSPVPGCGDHLWTLVPSRRDTALGAG